jgi:hypothetical protein
VNAFYSTPSAYVAAKQASNVSWTVKTDDFFPYADCPHCYWTGYFTSRPALKKNVRTQSGYLNTGRQIDAFLGGDGSSLDALAETVGLAQHHDAVSGTSKQHVAYDYAQRMAVGRSVAEKRVNGAFSAMAGGSSFIQCSTLNETFCEFTQKAKSFVTVAYNPLARSRSELVRLPVSGSAYIVYDSTGKVVPSQTEKSWVAFPKQFSPAPYVLYFQAQVPALGFATYFVQQSSSQPRPNPETPLEAAMIENADVRITFDSVTGAVSQILNKKSGISTPLTQQFMYYSAVQNSHQNSGAYIFRPNGVTPTPACTSKPLVSVIRGPVVSEVRTLCGWLAQTVRLSNADSFVEFEFQTSEVPIADGIGKEVITRFSTGIKSNGYVYTDSNGREFQTRKVRVCFFRSVAQIFRIYRIFFRIRSHTKIEKLSSHVEPHRYRAYCRKLLPHQRWSFYQG